MKKQLICFSLLGFFLPFLLAPKPVLAQASTTLIDSWLLSGINLLGLFLSGIMIIGLPLCLMLIEEKREDASADNSGFLVCFTITLLTLGLAVTSRFIMELWTDSMIVCAVISGFLMILTFCVYCIHKGKK